MAYTSPTFDGFKTAYPRFAAVEEPVFNAYLAKAVAKVGENWPESDYTEAQELYIAHLMTLEGLGTGTESKLAADGLSGVNSIRSGALSVGFGSAVKDAYAAFGALGSTTYGRRFIDLAKANFGGPVSARNDDAILAHAQAKDWPL